MFRIFVRLWSALYFGFTGVLAVIALIADPHKTAIQPGCVFLGLTGLQCPLCGGMRAVHSVISGAPGAGFAENALLFLLLPVTVAGLLIDLAVFSKKPDRMRRGFGIAFFIVLSAMFIGFTVIRNII
ncbi:MAG: hypothetical protein A2Y33_12730 [Spirochaetes bacterium GWF1_51_8]|nr:MAG: hypothetical protein A2Y33_12730 [Spirochaetes bacterium GWF1_51_8]